MSVVDVDRVSYSYGSHEALRELSLTLPEGSLYALLGPNGSGKTTLLQILMGLRRPKAGRVSVFGVDSNLLTVSDRAEIGYIAEGQALPGWMRLDQLEDYLAPLYPTWDRALANHLRDRFDLDPAKTINSMSRGQHMKAALLCSLAPRPRLLLMDEPFTGMDALVKDELVRGLLDSSGAEGWTVLLCSHDIGELEMLADWVGFLANGRMALSEPMDLLHQRFKRVEIVTDGVDTIDRANRDGWLSLERAGNRLRFVTSSATDDFEPRLRSHFSSAAHVDVRDASLREVFVALARQTSPSYREEVAI
ncbi:MAG TPA: ABC transporter ATP-binding protein [Gemmatimonadaceae bacterium]|jgi:ABC-2 type transport system ATP-binding protein